MMQVGANLVLQRSVSLQLFLKCIKSSTTKEGVGGGLAVLSDAV